ncbi:glycosyltransferase [Goodfellowiella coeruleoviolacea]|uniref:N-glycosyltransferase n=1 Tax=Goodfellowiella coeruleoviolacea TaxID=334858 RepID=A0AAE3KES2_9PSEU|nr:glycosyltransferase [Goodfellowiella coeruleoviolacea]MCP2164135.1 N-glycosyltransferase [Goodfellowiella coeruleoviolacea]
MLPLARALAEAGHEVLVAAPSALESVFANEPVRVRSVIPDMVEQLRHRMEQGGSPVPPDFDPASFDMRQMAVMMVAGPQVTENYRLLLPLAQEFGPDLVLRDGGELAVSLVAETLGIPHLSVPSGMGNAVDPALVLPALNERRAEVGLPTSDDPYSIYRYGRIDCMPPRFSFAVDPHPEPFAYRQPATVARDEVLPEWLAELPADRPLVIAAIGTALPLVQSLNLGVDQLPPQLAGLFNTERTMAAIVAGLSAVDCTAVVATAGFPVPEELVGDNVRLVDRFPQPLLLQCAQLFLTHGGYNSVRESVGAGVPMAVLPQFGDQPHNADRVQELGLGARVAEASAEEIARTCTRLLADASVTARARQAQRQMLALPPIQAAVADLERLCAGQVAAV